MNNGTDSFHIRITEELIDAFATLTGDRSSIHVNPEFARLSRFRRPVMHGMLPLVYLGAWAIKSGRECRPKRLKCQFLQPCFVGDNLDIRIVTSQAGEEIKSKFSVVRLPSGSIATEGEIDLVFAKHPTQSTRLSGKEKDLIFKENDYRLMDLTVGKEDALLVTSGPEFGLDLAEIFGKHCKGELTPLHFTQIDQGFMAALFLSTFVGMRIPGRYATLAEIGVEFSGGSLPETLGSEINLRGKVEKIMTASSRIKLSLDWARGKESFASGYAWSLVGEPAPESLTSEAIRAQFLSLGVQGKVALITGASRGIGETTAKLLALHGVKVCVHFFRGEKAAQAIINNICESGGEAITVGADIRDEQQVKAMFRQIESKLGPVDILINNAVAEFAPKEVIDLTWQDYLEELDVSLRGVHACCREAIPGMRARRAGKIINLGTVAVENPVSGHNRYITVKSALTGYTRSLAAELAGDNIQVNMIVPGMTRTSLLSGLSAQLLNRLSESSPSGALLEPIDVARSILFLISDWSRPVSGQRLVLSQGESPYL